MERFRSTVLALFVCLAASLAPTAAGAVPQMGDPAIDFELESLSGGSVSLSDFAGKVVFINFFGYT
tara:strand:- start:287 stop:484 length:198 start_codon:yes stop_codon:yes gene_type:complete